MYPFTRYRVRYISKRRVEITILPTRLGRFLGFEVRCGIAFRDSGEVDEESGEYWWWLTTERYVGRLIERCIEAAPMLSIDEMPIELLLGDGSEPDPKPKPRRAKP